MLTKQSQLSANEFNCQLRVIVRGEEQQMCRAIQTGRARLFELGWKPRPPAAQGWRKKDEGSSAVSARGRDAFKVAPRALARARAAEREAASA